MNLREEYNYLSTIIKMTDEEAERCFQLRQFFDSRHKILLIDADSLVWWACHKLLTYSEAKWLLENYIRELAEERILHLLYDRFERSIHEMVNHIESQDIDVMRIELFFSRCKDNFRYWYSNTYKGNRKGYRSPFLFKLQTYAIETMSSMYNVNFANKLEADDLIADKARFFGNNCILASLDKDLKQVPGCHFDYYKVRSIDYDTGEELKTYRGFTYTTEREGKELFFTQLLVGDSTDNIKGCKGIGEKRAEKILKGKSTTAQWIGVCRAYASKHNNWKELLKTNIKLIEL